MNKIREQLFNLKNDEYKNFNSKIINTQYPIIGVKTDILKRIAKENLVNYKNYFNEKHKYYEEFMIHGLMLGYLKLPIDELIYLLDQYIDMINCWSMVDSIVSNLKIFKKNLDLIFELSKQYIKSDDEFRVRFGYCILLCYFINSNNDKYNQEIINLCNKKHSKYYIQMMVAWLLSVYYIKYPEKGFEFLKDNKLDDFTHNKTISKICDSFRIMDDKTLIKKLRRIK